MSLIHAADDGSGAASRGRTRIVDEADMMLVSNMTKVGVCVVSGSVIVEEHKRSGVEYTSLSRVTRS